MAFYFRLDHHAKLLAVFSPKCGSTTLREWTVALAQQAKAGNGEAENEPFFVQAGQTAAYPDYYKVLFLRDPLRRLVSFYAYWVVRNPCMWTFADEQRRFWLNRKSFRRFMYTLEHLHRNRLDFQRHLQPQTQGIRRLDFDKVILVEQLHSGLMALNDRLGFQFTPPHKLRTDYVPGAAEPAADRSPEWLRTNGIPQARWFYDPELLKLAEEVYAEDLALHRGHGGVSISF
jgi:hypothetical protein